MQIREATPSDLEAMQRVLELVWTDRFERGYFNPRQNTKALIALEQESVIGFVAVQHRVWHPERQYLSLHVAPEFQGRGVGFALWEALNMKIERLQTATNQAKKFLERIGFSQIMQTWNPVFNVLEIDLEPFKTASLKTRNSGIEIKSFAEVSHLEDQIAVLHHELYAQAHMFNSPKQASLEEAKSVYLGDAIPEALFVGFKDEKPIGVSSLRGEAGEHELVWSGTLGNDTTTTLALVHHVLIFGLQNSIDFVTSEFDSLNPHAMAILEMLKIARGTAWLTFQN
jgi:N-acetylglutamate synthase-like GNAT family acetyltransferase